MKKIDKRTKAYKQSKGLGDTIEKITEATGIKAVVKSLFGDNCGCEDRKELLNKLFPYDKPNCLNEDEYLVLKDWFSMNRTNVRPREQRQLIDIYNRVLNRKQEMTNCTPCIKAVINDLRNLYIAYEKDLTKEQ